MLISRESPPDDLRHPADRPLFGFLVPFLAVTVAMDDAGGECNTMLSYRLEATGCGRRWS